MQTHKVDYDWHVTGFPKVEMSKILSPPVPEITRSAFAPSTKNWREDFRKRYGQELKEGYSS